MDCEEMDGLPPNATCTCRACRRAREDSIPFKLRLLAHRQMGMTTSFSISDAVMRRAMDAYIADRIGLSEMQVELIVALVGEVDRLCKSVSELVAMRPILTTKDHAKPA